jgi:hypothetical protein
MAFGRAGWHDHLRPGAKKAFINAAKASTAEYPEYYNIDTSGRAWEEYLVSAGLGTLGLKPEGVSVPFDEPVPRGKVRLTHLTYGLGYAVTEEVSEDELYRAIVPPNSRYLMAAHRDGEEVVAAAPYNLAFTTQQGYDGVALMSTAHPGVGIANQANRPATDIDISVTALQGSMERYMLRLDDRGLRLNLTPQKVLHHPNLFWVTREILTAEKKPFTSNNEQNITGQQGLMPSTWRYLTDPDAWITLAPGGNMDNPANHTFIFSWRRKPRFDDDFDKLAGKVVFFVTSRFSVGVIKWQHVDGSPGA